MPHSLEGTFAANVDPADSDPFWKRLENGSYDGIYFVADGTFPAVSGTSFSIPEFDIALRDASGNVVIRYVSGSDFGGFFADFFGPGSGDTFVFADGRTQFQVAFPSGFDGNGEAVDENGVFGEDPPGGIRSPSGTAKAGEVLAIDVTPHTLSNRVNPRSRGQVSVAILGSAEFDVLDVEVTTLAYARDGATPTHRKGGHLRDVNFDGFMDLVSHYRIPETGIATGDEEACLAARTLDGRPLFGCDVVRTTLR